MRPFKALRPTIVEPWVGQTATLPGGRQVDRAGESPDHADTTAHAEHVASRLGSWPSRAQVAIWAAGMLLAALLALSDFDSFQLGVYNDDAFYLILARSLLESDSYGLINAPGQPGQTHFPFGYPLLVAQLQRAFPGNIEVLKAASLAATLLNGTLLFWGWRAFRPRDSYWWAAAVSALYLLSPLTIAHTRMVMSEAVFTTFCLAAVLLVRPLVQGYRPTLVIPALSVVLVFVAFTRTTGVILVGTLFAYLLLVRGLAALRLSAWLLVGMGCVLAGLIAATPLEPRDLIPYSYAQSTGGFVRDVVLGVEEEGEEGGYVSGLQVLEWRVGSFFSWSIGTLILPLDGAARRLLVAWTGGPGLPVALGYLAAATAALGAFRRWRRDRLNFHFLFAVAYLGMLFVWFWSGHRLLYPIQSELYLAFLLGLHGLIQVGVGLAARWGVRAGPLLANRLFVASVLLLVASFCYRTLRLEPSLPHVGDIEARTVWLRAYAEPAAVVMTELPEADYVYSGRTTVPYPAARSSAEQVEDYLDRRGVDYVLVAPSATWQRVYSPFYSPSAKALLTTLDELVSRGSVVRVHASEPDLVQVFRATKQQGQRFPTSASVWPSGS